jgi:hypothetical protein
LRGEAGGVVVIDWDRSERQSPIFLDALTASHYHTARYLLNGSSGSSWAAWQLLFDQDERLPLRPELDRARGEFTWTAMVAFGLLNGIQRNVLSAEQHKLSEYRRLTEECLRRLRQAATRE